MGNPQFGQLRKRVYASINGTKGNLMTWKKSSLLTKIEKELLQAVIDDIEKLRIQIKANNSLGAAKNWRNFFVKDLSIRDSLITYPTEFKGVFVIGFAAIDGNKVTRV